MEGSRGGECSKACPSDQINEDGEESEENDTGRRKATDGSGSSSNSTIDENEKKSLSVRPYIRSKTPRLRWTQDLHLRFVQAVERLGGQERATPKLVLQLMNIKGVNIAHVKSHLQMYRSKKIDDPSQVISNHRNFLDGGDRNIYNLSQLPMLQSYNPRSFRYGDAPWNIGHDEKWVQSSSMSRSAVDNARPIFYSSATERIFGRNSTICDHVHIDVLSTSSELSTWKIHERKDGLGESIHDQERRRGDKSLLNPMQLKSSIIKLQENVPLDLEATSLQKRAMVKRKNSDCDLDLNLTLGVKSRNDDSCLIRDLEDENKYLLLSLYSPSSSKKVGRLKFKEVDREEDAGTGRASTLDLTI